MTRRNPALYIEDMLLYARKVGEFITGMSEEAFLADERTMFAVIRCFEVIGEAANKIPKPLQEKYHSIPWAQIIAFRNFLIHEYLGISMKRVWVSAVTVLPETLPHLEDMLASELQEGYQFMAADEETDAGALEWIGRSLPDSSRRLGELNDEWS